MIIPVEKLPTDPMAGFPNLRQQELQGDIEDLIANRFPVCEIISVVPKTQIPRGSSFKADLKLAIETVVKQIQETQRLKSFDGASAFDLKIITPEPSGTPKTYITFDVAKWDQMLKEARSNE